MGFYFLRNNIIERQIKSQRSLLTSAKEIDNKVIQLFYSLL